MMKEVERLEQQNVDLIRRVTFYRWDIYRKWVSRPDGTCTWRQKLAPKPPQMFGGGQAL